MSEQQIEVGNLSDWDTSTTMNVCKNEFEKQHWKMDRQWKKMHVRMVKSNTRDWKVNKCKTVRIEYELPLLTQVNGN